MSADRSRPEIRADLRDLEDHYGWEEVYQALHCSPDAAASDGDRE